MGKNEKADIDVLTMLNMMKYISYYFCSPVIVTENLRMYHFFSVKDEFTAKEFRSYLSMQSKHAYPDLKKMTEERIVEKTNKEKYKVIDSAKVAEKMKPALDNIQENIKKLPDELVANIYKAMALLYISYSGNKNPQNFSDLVFYMHAIYAKFCMEIIPAGKKQLTRTLILYYLDIFGALKTRRLHRILPAVTNSNVLSTAKLMEKDGMVQIKNKKPKTVVDIEITKKGKVYLEENKKNAKAALETISGNARNSELFVLALQGIAEVGSNLLQFQNIEEKA